MDSETIKRLETAIEKSRTFFLSQQYPEGYWVDELESNATITAEYIFFMHFMGRVDSVKMEKCANYLLKKQREDGSWPLFYGGACDINSTVESYLALKMAGIPVDRPEMLKAREAIFANGGIAKTRVFTKIFLAMLGQSSWDFVPAVPVEIVLLPNCSPFNIYEMSSWSRGTVVPLSVVCAYRPVFELPAEKGIAELFREEDRDLSIQPTGPAFSSWRNTFIYMDRFIKFLASFNVKPLRKKALKAAERWILDHQEDEGDFAGIQPAMFNSMLALHYMGYPDDHPALVKGFEAIERFELSWDDQLGFQACVSPLWDTAIGINALLDSGMSPDDPALVKGGEWILTKQVVKPGDWKVKNPDAEPGGWAFEFYNECYPDNDDTAEILIALDRLDLPDHRHKLAECQRAMTWLLSMQSKNGGWGAFDMDNDLQLLNEIPFADHKAMLDEPTADVTGRILWCLGRLGFSREHPQVRRALEFVRKMQEPDGCWWGRWGVNYIYGTFLVTNGLRSMGEDMTQPYLRKTVDWLVAHQNEDGGWGETCDSYADPSLRGQGESSCSQTAWAMLGLMALGEGQGEAMRKGAEFLMKRQLDETGSWYEPQFTGTGFPVHFYIKYHMYQHFFPLMALSRYRNELTGVGNEEKR
ncbi:MAG: squalene--hopene cyclase [Candidatus Nitrohelix vancouverensis]|uniref:Squalene--hopene cyclase n=1 Tax=Candidatus Nitrohelix vancouverensis TaxID=2705534 RepID=A0A7T0BZR1_9BACT|nr:MAG: squalene--hopene cyclase [Candidatus Nitrohelix vancouverensis]